MKYYAYAGGKPLGHEGCGMFGWSMQGWDKGKSTRLIFSLKTDAGAIRRAKRHFGDYPHRVFRCGHNVFDLDSHVEITPEAYRPKPWETHHAVAGDADTPCIIFCYKGWFAVQGGEVARLAMFPWVLDRPSSLDHPVRIEEIHEKGVITLTGGITTPDQLVRLVDNHERGL